MHLRLWVVRLAVAPSLKGWIQTFLGFKETVVCINVAIGTANWRIQQKANPSTRISLLLVRGRSLASGCACSFTGHHQVSILSSAPGSQQLAEVGVDSSVRPADRVIVRETVLWACGSRIAGRWAASFVCHGHHRVHAFLAIFQSAKIAVSNTVRTTNRIVVSMASLFAPITCFPSRR